MWSAVYCTLRSAVFTPSLREPALTGSWTIIDQLAFFFHEHDTQIFVLWHWLLDWILSESFQNLWDSLSQYLDSNGVLVCRQAFSKLGVFKVQQWVGSINEIMNVKSWMVLKWNHCHYKHDLWKAWCGKISACFLMQLTLKCTKGMQYVKFARYVKLPIRRQIGITGPKVVQCI